MVATLKEAAASRGLNTSAVAYKSVYIIIINLKFPHYN